MKVVSLNLWGGRVHEPLMDFLRKYRDVDVFCLQEVYHNAHGKDTIWTNGTNFDALSDIQRALPDHEALYHPHLGDWWGLAMFVRRDLKVRDSGEYFIHLHKGHINEEALLGHTAKNIQYLTTFLGDTPLTIINVHGLWNGKGKSDTEARLVQSERIVEFAKTLRNGFLLCGDLNLAPDTESLRILERDLSLRNLITEYGITSTRTSFYKKPDKIADYALVSPGIDVLNFEVLPDEVSDHSPLYVELG